MDIIYDSLFVTNPVQYQTSSGIKLCNEHGNITEGSLEAEKFGYSSHIRSLRCLWSAE